MKKLFKKMRNFFGEAHSFSKTHDREQQISRMPKPVILEELQIRSNLLLATAIICGLLFILFIWSSIASIDEVAVTYGEIVTSIKVSDIQHLEGGIIKDVLVKEGDIVKKGQLLATLDDVAAKAELQQLQAKKVTLKADIDRLRAFIENKNFNTKKLQQSDLNNPNFEEQYDVTLNKVLQANQELLAIENQSQKNQQEILMSQIDQKKSEIHKLTSQLSLINKNKKLLANELGIYQKLIKKQYVSQREYIAKQREATQLESDTVNIEFELTKAKDSMKEYVYKLQELNTSIDKEALDDLNKSADELFQVQFALDKLKDRVKREKIIAPVAGVVKGIQVITGTVINPSGVLMTIVPSGQTLQAETRITTLDIGHIHVGDPAIVKILTYDYSRYGSIAGKLTKISATTFFDENNKISYYKGTIELDKQYVQNQKYQLKSGMTVQADIITGKKTVLEYLLKPIQTNIHSSFHER